MKPGKIPNRAGAGFKTCHAREILEGRPKAAWFEIHPENYMVAGGPRLKTLEDLRENYPVAFHGLALSLAGCETPDKDHLQQLKSLVERFEPGLISEHIVWSSFRGHYFADLLPVPFTRQVLSCLVRNINQVQDFLGRQILIENPAQYLELPGHQMSEVEFITETARQTGCGILLDLNNIFVTGQNLGKSTKKYIEGLDLSLVGEVHLAGFKRERFRGQNILIDSHSDAISKLVWDLFETLITRTGPLPTLIEWDNEIPNWRTLEAEVKKAQTLLSQKRKRAA